MTRDEFLKSLTFQPLDSISVDGSNVYQIREARKKVLEKAGVVLHLSDDSYVLIGEQPDCGCAYHEFEKMLYDAIEYAVLWES